MFKSVYGLIDPTIDKIFYVGVTQQGPERRLNEHISEARRGLGSTEKSHYIERLMRQDVWPMIVVLETCTDDNWQQREQKWISIGHGAGWPLVNKTIGGNGQWGSKQTPATKAKIAAGVKARNSQQKFEKEEIDREQKKVIVTPARTTITPSYPRGRFL